jgi:glycine/D-amino acid oxidase-like deaminating enzyme
LDSIPTEEGRRELLAGLAEWAQLPVEVLDQQAAVRPGLRDFRPAIGLHPELPLGYFNGLGSKGSLLAPRLAEQLTDRLIRGTPICHELDVARWQS